MRTHAQVVLQTVFYLFASQVWLPALLAMIWHKVEKCTPGRHDPQGITTQEETWKDTDVCI